MTSRPVFTNTQWVAAIGAALSLHVLLAWSLILHEPTFQPVSRGQGSGLAVQRLSLSGSDLPLLTDVAAGTEAPAVVDPLPASERVVHPVAPPDVRPLTQALSIERKHQPANKSKPRAKKALTKAPKGDPKMQQPRSAGKSPPNGVRSASDKVTRSNKGNRAQPGSGPNGKRGMKGPAGVNRAAAPQPGNPRPRYPRLARNRGQEGRVLIRVSVLGNGRVGSASVSGSSGHSSLDRAALAAVKRWRFKPALRAGKPVTAMLTVPVVFRLEG